MLYKYDGCMKEKSLRGRLKPAHLNIFLSISQNFDGFFCNIYFGKFQISYSYGSLRKRITIMYKT